MTAPMFGSAKPPPFDRDYRGRPKVTMPDGTETTYTRVTTFIDCLEDKSNLEKWLARMTLIGASKGTAAERNKLAKKVVTAAAMLQLAETEGDDGAAKEAKKTLDGYVQECKILAGTESKADEGTANHSLTELIDRGHADKLPDNLDAETKRDLQAYIKATQGLRVLESETGVVNDRFKCAGTFDRRLLVEPGFGWPDWLEGRTVIGDLKTGRVDYGLAKMCMQLGVYANSVRYNTLSKQRDPLDVDRAVGLIVHLPAGKGVCEVWALDLAFGYAQVALAEAVREYRSVASRKVKPFATSLKQVA